MSDHFAITHLGNSSWETNTIIKIIVYRVGKKVTFLMHENFEFEIILNLNMLIQVCSLI